MNIRFRFPSHCVHFLQDVFIILSVSGAKAGKAGHGMTVAKTAILFALLILHEYARL